MNEINKLRSIIDEEVMKVLIEINKDMSMDFIARKSNHIQSDIKRNWSSWNFGELGFEGTKQELKSEIDNAIENDNSFDISGFELWGSDIKKADIRELYSNYWVLVDNVNAEDGLSGVDLNCDNLKDAIKQAKKSDYSGDGVSFDVDDYKLVKSINDIHIFQYVE